jgi:hypothetical protein
MMDPMAALGVAGNIVQFVDFSIKLFRKAHEIHTSMAGNLRENLDAKEVANTIRILQSRLRLINRVDTPYVSETQSLLEGLCSSCDETANELLETLKMLEIQGKKTAWKSMRQAMKSVMGKAAVLEISSRLENFRGLLEMTVLVELRYVDESKLNIICL